MSEPKHSPAPWKMGTGRFDKHHVIDAAGEIVCFAMTAGRWEGPRSLADRDLILAAPRMLAILKVIADDNANEIYHGGQSILDNDTADEIAQIVASIEGTTHP